MKAGIFACWVLLLLVPLCAANAGSDLSAKPTPLTRLDDATKSLMDKMTDNQVRQFAAIRDTHGIIRAVQDVETNLKKAVANCSDQNPDLTTPINERFAHWSGTIDPILDEARQRLNMMVKLQDFTRPERMRGYLKMVDDAVAYKARGVKSVPIATKDECEKLIDKLDDTEKELKETLIENLGLNKQLQTTE